jgi:hypothetical protein
VEVAFKWSIAQLTLVGMDQRGRGTTGRTKGDGGRGREGRKIKKEGGMKHTEV